MIAQLKQRSSERLAQARAIVAEALPASKWYRMLTALALLSALTFLTVFLLTGAFWTLLVAGQFALHSLILDDASRL